MKIPTGYRNKFVLNDMADDLTIMRLRITVGYISGRSAPSDRTGTGIIITPSL